MKNKVTEHVDITEVAAELSELFYNSHVAQNVQFAEKILDTPYPDVDDKDAGTKWYDEKGTIANEAICLLAAEELAQTLRDEYEDNELFQRIIAPEPKIIPLSAPSTPEMDEAAKMDEYELHDWIVNLATYQTECMETRCHIDNGITFEPEHAADEDDVAKLMAKIDRLLVDIIDIDCEFHDLFEYACR